MEEAQRRVDEWIERADPERYLDLSALSLTTLPDLPRSLWLLHCWGNQIRTLPELPSSLEMLDCSFNQIKMLPALPSSLKVLFCSDNPIRALPVLPRSLVLLNCSRAQIRTFPELPGSLHVLGCSGNQIQTLPVLPSFLHEVYCYNNQIEMLPVLPRSLQVLDCKDNRLPDFSIQEWKRLSNIRRSIHLRTFQRRCRRKLIRKRTRPKDLLNYSIYGRPGLGMGWFEMCAEVGHDPRRYDRKKYGLRRQVQ